MTTTTQTRITWTRTGAHEIGDQHGPLYLERTTVDGRTITRQRKRDTRDTTIYIVDGYYYTTLRAALRAVRP